jgi:hypothetical protein
MWTRELTFGSREPISHFLFCERVSRLGLPALYRAGDCGGVRNVRAEF